jgi:hypothetical protein
VTIHYDEDGPTATESLRDSFAAVAEELGTAGAIDVILGLVELPDVVRRVAETWQGYGESFAADPHAGPKTAAGHLAAALMCRAAADLIDDE